MKVVLFLNPVILCARDAGFGCFAFYLRLSACGAEVRHYITAFVLNNALFPLLRAASDNGLMIELVPSGHQFMPF